MPEHYDDQHDTMQDRSFKDVMEGLVNRLETEARERVSLRRMVEERWLVDIAQYEGRDNPALTVALTKEKRSTSVVNVTRPKCNTFESKVFDLLFPTDDRNWAIGPTPVSEDMAELKQIGRDIDVLTAAANESGNEDRAGELTAEADALAQRMAEIEEAQHEARSKADLMQEEIADNLIECEWPTHCRAAIHDAAVCGTGIVKGPIPLSERVRPSWMREDGGTYRLKFDPESEGRFVFQHVSYWHIFPESTASSFDRCNSWFERHLMTETDLRAFAKQPGVDKDAVRRLLDEGPQDILPEYMLELEAVTSEEVSTYTKHVFVVWEYRGPLEREEMDDLMRELLRSEEGDEPMSVEVDPLIQMDAVLFFCQGEVLKWGINHMDDNSPIYSVFQIERTTARLWAVGLPFILREQQSILNDAWRGMMDNAALAALPQLEINTAILQRPEGSPPIIEPGAIWERNSGAGQEPGMIVHEIPIRQEHFSSIIELTMRFIDIETNISVLAAGEQGAHTTRTAGGIGLLMNAVNVVFRQGDQELTMTGSP